MPCTLNGPSLVVKFTNEIGGGKSVGEACGRKRKEYICCVGNEKAYFSEAGKSLPEISPLYSLPRVVYLA